MVVALEEDEDFGALRFLGLFVERRGGVMFRLEDVLEEDDWLLGDDGFFLGCDVSSSSESSRLDGVRTRMRLRFPLPLEEDTEEGVVGAMSLFLLLTLVVLVRLGL